MAFIFTVEDGTGLPDSNSYVGVSDAEDILFPDTARYAAFVGATQEEKESALALGTAYLETHFKWDGDKYVSDSSLGWPRSSATDRNDIVVATDVVPRAVESATALMAALIIEGKASFSDNANTTQEYPITDLKVDVIAINYQVPDTEYVLPIDQTPEEIKLILKGLGASNTGSNSFVKINK